MYSNIPCSVLLYDKVGLYIPGGGWMVSHQIRQKILMFICQEIFISFIIVGLGNQKSVVQ